MSWLLVQTSVENAQVEGISQAYSMGLSNYSQKIFTNMGFEEKKSINYSEYQQVQKSSLNIEESYKSI